MIKKRMRGDNRGLTLIELLCAVAILSIISATVSGAMIVATNSYRSGTTEAALQQEAQYTANSIESLIVDATDEVTFTGNVLKIKNTDYTYEITHDPVDKTLKFIQYETNDPSKFMFDMNSPQLLAEHVENFVVTGVTGDPKEFNKTRNLQIQLVMENNDRKLTTSYSFTSRNDPSAGNVRKQVAMINCEDFVVLEPLQTYFFRVDVVGPSDKGINPSLEPEEDGTIDATVTRVPNGVEIYIGPTENGGTDGMLRMKLETQAKDSSANPLKTKYVEVKIRRIRDIDITPATPAPVSGVHLKTGAEYTFHAEPTGTNLDLVGSASFENSYSYNRVNYSAYVDPRTIGWRFEVSTGEPWQDYIEVIDPPGTSNKDVQFRLKKNITGSVYVDAIAVAQHPEGMRGALQTNKTGRRYGTVEKAVRLKEDNRVQGQFFRGNESEVAFSQDYNEMVREAWMKEHPGDTWDESEYGYNGGYTGNSYLRYISTDGTSTSPNYPEWIAMSMEGNNPSQLEFKSADFDGMLYTKDYDMEILFGFIYSDRQNHKWYYPTMSRVPDPPAQPAPPAPDISSEYILKFTMYGFAFTYESCRDSVGNVNLTPYLVSNGKGVGSLTNPVRLVKNGTIEFSYKDMVGAETSRGAADSAMRSMKFEKWYGSGWSPVGGVDMQLESWGTNPRYKTEGKIRINTANGGMAGSNGYGLYRMSVDKIAGEQYAQESSPNQGGKGFVYFELVDSR